VKPGRRQNYAAFPGPAMVESLKAFEADPLTLFMEDLPRMYELGGLCTIRRPKSKANIGPLNSTLLKENR